MSAPGRAFARASGGRRLQPPDAPPSGVVTCSKPLPGLHLRILMKGRRLVARTPHSGVALAPRIVRFRHVTGVNSRKSRPGIRQKASLNCQTCKTRGAKSAARSPPSFRPAPGARPACPRPSPPHAALSFRRSRGVPHVPPSRLTGPRTPTEPICRPRPTSAATRSARGRCATSCPSDVYQKLVASIRHGKKLDLEIAPVVAQVIKEWAISRGVTHFTHWFQPQTGLTAEKHDAFLSFDENQHADGVVLGVAADPERAGRVELPVGRPARDVGSARLHGVESGEPGVHRRDGRRRGRCASRRCSSATTAKRSTR